MEKMTGEECVLLLKSKAEECGRLPKKGDFPPETTALIKGYFGPWRYALEEAGLLPSKREALLLKNKEKHVRAKINRRNAKKNKSEVLS